MKRLCENCGREFHAERQIVEQKHYGETKEFETEETLCPDCRTDLGMEDEGNGEVDTEDDIDFGEVE